MRIWRHKQGGLLHNVIRRCDTLTSMVPSSSPCQEKQLIGHLVWHEVSFRCPSIGQLCELPENQQGVVEHIFVNGSIYPQTFSTTVSTQPTALRIIGPESPPAVKVPKCVRGPLRTKNSTGKASQTLEHLHGTGVGLPHTATADFSTTATPPWGSSSSPETKLTISITLTR